MIEEVYRKESISARRFVTEIFEEYGGEEEVVQDVEERCEEKEAEEDKRTLFLCGEEPGDSEYSAGYDVEYASAQRSRKRECFRLSPKEYFDADFKKSKAGAYEKSFEGGISKERNCFGADSSKNEKLHTFLNECNDGNRKECGVSRLSQEKSRRNI